MESLFKSETEVGNYVSQLSNEEISRALKALDFPVGPVTRITRLLYENLLADLMCKSLPKSTNKDSDRSTNAIESCDRSNLKSEISKGSQIVAGDGGEKKTEQRAGKSFFGVQVPATYNKQGPHVFEDQQEMIKFLKTVPGARFKMFRHLDEANVFSTSCDIKCTDFIRMRDERQEDDRIPNSSYQKENLPFSSVKYQEFIFLRKVLETGNVEKVKELVWKNPRYLIGNGDNPTILQEGCRYNAMHISCKSNQLESCKFIMETITNHDFYFLLYREDMPHKRQTRMDFLLDMYLNNRERVFQDTPLHFACKFGHEEIVRYLVSLPMTDTEARNGAGLKPREVIGSRLKDVPQKLIRSIDAAFEDLYYIFIIRTEDNSEPPQVSLPFCPTRALFTPVVPPVHSDRHYWDLFKSQIYLGEEDESPVGISWRPMSAKVSTRGVGGGDETDLNVVTGPSLDESVQSAPKEDELNSKNQSEEIFLRESSAEEEKVSVACKTPSNEKVIILADPGAEITLASYVTNRDEVKLSKSQSNFKDMVKWEKMVNTPVFSAKEIPRKIRGVAGPMPLVVAELFRSVVLLNHVPKKFKRDMKLIKRTDDYKGLERVCRYVARELDLSWSEHWSFLDCDVDLSSPMGLKLFEEHMKGVLEFSISMCSPALNDKREDLLDKIFEKIKSQDCPKSFCRKEGVSDDLKPRKNSIKSGLEIYIHGDIPTKADVDAFRAVKHVEKMLSDYPCVNCWFQCIATFSESEKSRWLDASTVSHILSTPQNNSLSYLKSIKEMRFMPNVKQCAHLD